jgi:anti-sigma-K factor RskA
MTNLDHDRWSEDLATYMLGALSAEEAEALERHAEGCDRCRSEIRWLTPAVQALPEAVERVEPPRELRDRVMAEVLADAGGRVRTDGAGEPGVLRRASDWLRELGAGPMGLRPVVGLAAAVLVVAAVAGFAIGGGIGGSEGDTSTVVVGHAPGVTAKLTRNDDRGTLQLANVRPVPSHRVLEAWVRRDGQVEPVRALFVPDRKGRALTTINDMSGVDLVMVTTEPRGGSRAPTSAPVVSVPIPQ